MAETTKDKLEAGDKKRAGRLVSTFLRSVAQEKVAGETGAVTRAEALARLLWDMALGRSKIVDMETGKITTECSSPDKHAMDIVIDRIEGKTGTFEQEKTKSESVPKKVSRKNKQRINKISTNTNKKDGSLKSK